MITYEDFKKLELKVGEIAGAEEIPGSTNLLKLTIDLGTERRQVVAGIAKDYRKDALVGKQVVLLVNLEPRKVWGVESNGMILAAADSANVVAIISPDKKMANGAPVM